VAERDDDMVVTPWNVSGDVDYDRLIQRFGTKPISEEILSRIKRHSGELHLQLRRRVFFSHRDLDNILDKYEEGRGFALYTGRGPSGPVHIGHLVSWVFTKHLQDVFGAKLFFQLTEDERLLIRDELKEDDVEQWAYENSLDLMALGFGPENTELIANIRHVDKLYETALKVAKKITASTAKAIFGFGDDTNAGMIFFPAMQAAPCFLASAQSGEEVPCLVPAGIDQDTYWRMTRDIALKLGYPKPAQIHCRLLPGLEGSAKMSSSIPETAVYTTDRPEVIERKIMGSHTGRDAEVDEAEHPRYPAKCPIYQYYYFIFEESDKRLADITCLYSQGDISCAECKAELAERVKRFLIEHQSKRERMGDVVARMLS
jgi:tryptophanyl-tRNA synthetase